MTAEERLTELEAKLDVMAARFEQVTEHALTEMWNRGYRSGKNAARGGHKGRGHPNGLKKVA